MNIIELADTISGIDTLTYYQRRSIKLAAEELRRLRAENEANEALLRQILEFLERRSMGAEHLIAALRERLGEQQ